MKNNPGNVLQTHLPRHRELKNGKLKNRAENFLGFMAAWTFYPPLFTHINVCAKNCLGLTRTIHSAWTTASIQFHSTSTSLLIKHIKWCHKNWKSFWSAPTSRFNIHELLMIKAPQEESFAKHTDVHAVKWSMSECEKQRSIRWESKVVRDVSCGLARAFANEISTQCRSPSQECRNEWISNRKQQQNINKTWDREDFLKRRSSKSAIMKIWLKSFLLRCYNFPWKWEKLPEEVKKVCFLNF